MNIDILEKKEVPLFSRVEIKAQIKFPGTTPSTNEVTKILANNLSVDEKTIVVRNISTKFGFREAKVIAHVYTKEEDMKRIEPAYLFKSEKSKEKTKSEKDLAIEKSSEKTKPEEASLKTSEEEIETLNT